MIAVDSTSFDSLMTRHLFVHHANHRQTRVNHQPSPQQVMRVGMPGAHQQHWTLDGACRADHELGTHVHTARFHGVGLGARTRWAHLRVGSDCRRHARTGFILQTLHLAVVDQRDPLGSGVRQVGDKRALLGVVGAAQCSRTRSPRSRAC